MTDLLSRRAARVLLVDPASRVLLLTGGDPLDPAAGSWWMTPGGGVEPGETSSQAAVRELAEETGLQVEVDDLGAVVHRRRTSFRFAGQDYRVSEEYFLLRVPAFEVDTSGPGALVDPGVTGHRWWPLAALRDTQEVVFPAELAELVDGLIASGTC